MYRIRSIPNKTGEEDEVVSVGFWWLVLVDVDVGVDAAGVLDPMEVAVVLVILVVVAVGSPSSTSRFKSTT